MHTKHPPIHNRPQSEIIKHIAAIPPHVPTPVFPATLVVESVHLCYLAGLVIAADEGDAVWVPDFEEEEEEEGLDGEEAAVYKVACGLVCRLARVRGREGLEGVRGTMRKVWVGGRCD